ncbi:uncharacterized protein LOC115921500 [Strongylocentrotus purpuratus]|uniref:Uncharacterized protein n=1 Tax=Strongylocentrotus purpuratus TaxID=7668 RepID=A0A7M7ND63_STRPU|nr:uncharacterized protein LOC115921500 [Strongylocentrotus purpuratus]
MQVETLTFYVQCPTPSSSHQLAEALCSMPNLTDLALFGVGLTEEFHSALKAKASFIQVQTLRLNVKCPTPASSHHLVEALCAMPNLTELILGSDVNEEVYCTLKAKTSSIQVRVYYSKCHGEVH